MLGSSSDSGSPGSCSSGGDGAGDWAQTGANGSRQHEEGIGHAGMRGSSGRRVGVAMWLLGLCNNSIYVIMNAGAGYILPGAVGLIYVCNNVPNLAVMGTGPYWFHLVSYTTRVRLCAACSLLSVLLVALSSSTAVQLLGVLVGSFSQGLGESSMLALNSFYGQKGLSAWSSGTGLAGIFGYAFKAAVVDAAGYSFSTALLLSSALPMCFLATFHWALPKPGAGDVYDSLPDSAQELTEHEQEQDDLSDLQEGAEPRALATSTSSAAQLHDGDGPASLRERLDLFASLWPFTVPLFAVYFAEYAMQAGTWAAMGFPESSPLARERFYLYSNWLYQVGVFFSRSSAECVSLSSRQLWLLPLVQVALLGFFVADASWHFWWDYSVLVLCLAVGLVGGAVYVQTFCLMSQQLPPRQLEFSLAAASVAATAGSALSNVAGLLIQGCLVEWNGIADQEPPLFRCGYPHMNASSSAGAGTVS